MPEMETLRNGRRKVVLEALKQGCTRSAACEKAGINRETLRRWMHEDAALHGAVTRAEAECEARMTEALTAAALDDWRAAESWLKRRRREEWGDRIDIKQLPDDVIIRLLERDAARGVAPGGDAPAVASAVDAAAERPSISEA